MLTHARNLSLFVADKANPPNVHISAFSDFVPRLAFRKDGAIETASTKVLLASATRLAGKPGGVQLLREALHVLEREPQLGPMALINTYTLLAACLMDEGSTEEPLELLGRARELAGNLPGDSQPEMQWMVLSMLASTHERLGHHSEAERVAREALALTGAHGARAEPWYLAGLNTLALSLAGTERLQEARELYEQLLPRALAFYGQYNVVFAQMQIEFAVLRARLGERSGLAEPLLESFNVLRSGLGLANQKSLVALENLIDAMVLEARADECPEILRSCLAELQSAEVRDDSAAARVLYFTAVIAFVEGDRAETARCSREALALKQDDGMYDAAAPRALLAYALAEDPATRAEASELAQSLLDSNSLHAASLARYVLLRMAVARADDEACELLLNGAPSVFGTRVPWAVSALRIRHAERLVHGGDTAVGCPLLKQSLAELEMALGALHPELQDARARIEVSGAAAVCAKFARQAGR
jgi:tetratricopeptide (TPR) repeat protein